MSRRDDGPYWEKRRLDLLGQLEKDEDRLYKRLEKVYASEIARLERDIAAYYREYGEDDVIAYRKLLVSLSERDRRLLIEQMEEFAEKYPQHAHLLPVRESIYKLNEMEGIQLSMRIQQLRIGAIEEEEVTAHLEKLAQRSANLAAEQMGFGTAFYAVDASVVKAVVGTAWAQGEAFSERIWGNRQKLAAYLADDFAKAVARGASYERITREISDRFDGVSKRNIHRLVYTEGTYVFNESHARVHAQWYSHYSLSTVTDGRACDQCRDVERRTVAEPALFEERMPGANFPPLHPGCRCSYVVVIERDDDEDYAQKVLDAAASHEVETTKLLKSLESDDARLSGLEYRLKGKESLRRKIEADAMGDKITHKEASERIADALRYTYVIPSSKFGEVFQTVRASMAEKGYDIGAVKNTLQFENVPYRGVNTRASTPDGYIFELQFHTPESLDVKERLNHPLYEKARLLETPEDEKAALYAQMASNANSIPMPEGIKEVR